MTPFKALYGFNPSQLPILPLSDISVGSVANKFTTRQNVNALLWETLSQAQNKMKHQCNKKRIERSFEVGDWVYHKLQPYRQTSVAVRKSLKLYVKYYGPYKVVAKVGTVTYKQESSISWTTLHQSRNYL